jgi:PHD/YefM family antitoxin component YafN of YafNO toxin-antitoxin module
MSTINSGSAGADRAPSFEAACATHQQVVFTHDARRLYWTLNGPLVSAIFVMDNDYYDPDTPLEPYCLHAGPEPSWSSVAQSPLTEPKISSVTVSVEQLDDWEDQWFELHRDHAVPIRDDSNDQMSPVYESDQEEEEETGSFLNCDCKNRPPSTKFSLVVNATEGFLTIHDYVSVVHPWLMSHRETILRASGDLLDDIPLPPSTRLMITSYTHPNALVTVEEAEWRHKNSKETILRFKQQIGAWKAEQAIAILED